MAENISSFDTQQWDAVFI